MYVSPRATSPFASLFNHRFFAHGRLFYRFHGSEACRFSPQAAFRLLGHLAADNGRPTTLWDPFCGTGFILSAASFFFPQAFPRLLGSDISAEAVACTARNLALFHSREAFAARCEEMRRAMRPNAQSQERWTEVLTYFESLGATLDFEYPAFTHRTAVADARVARHEEEALTMFGDLPYGRASQLTGASDYLGCLEPLLRSHPQARALFIAPLSAAEDFRVLAITCGRPLRVRRFKGGRIGAAFAPLPVALDAPVPAPPEARFAPEMAP